MYQTQMFQLLQELGGKARYRDIFAKALQIDSRYKYNDVQKTLRRMKNRETVSYDNKTGEYYICSQIQDQDN